MEKPKSRLYAFLFSAAIFILTCIAYTGSLIYTLPLPWLAIIFIVIFLLLFAVANYVLTARFKWSTKKGLLLALGVMLTATIVTQTAWTLMTPTWSFSVTTDKSPYSLGENVKITATLRNTGFISHSFKSKVNDPVLICIFQQVNPTNEIPVWWSWTPFSSQEITEFFLSPNQVLQRDFTWNQTNIANPSFWNQTYMAGAYHIAAFIPDVNAEVVSPDYVSDLFFASTNINVTQS